MSEAVVIEEKPNLEVITEEEKPNTEVKPEVKKSLLAETFQRINKQEKFVSEERRKIEEAKKSLESEKQYAESYKQLKGKSPFEILEHFGISYEQLLEADKERNNPVDPNVRKALEKVQELESKLTAKEREKEQAELAKAEIQLKADISDEIKKGDYDLIDKLSAHDAVKDYMEEIFATTGEVPTIKEACEAVTSYIVEQYSSIKDSRFLKPKEEPKIEAIKEEKASKPEAISNKMVQTSEHSTKPLTEAQRMAAAIQVMAAMSK